MFFDKLTPQQVADILGVSKDTLTVWRCTKRYKIPYIKIGSKVVYRAKDIEAFIESRTFSKEVEYE